MSGLIVVTGPPGGAAAGRLAAGGYTVVYDGVLISQLRFSPVRLASAPGAHFVE